MRWRTRYVLLMRRYRPRAFLQTGWQLPSAMAFTTSRPACLSRVLRPILSERRPCPILLPSAAADHLPVETGDSCGLAVASRSDLVRRSFKEAAHISRSYENAWSCPTSQSTSGAPSVQWPGWVINMLRRG